MPKASRRSRQQIKSDRAQLRRLRDSGLYSGKIDLRRKPSGNVKTALKRYDDVVKGRAKVIKPKSAASYKDIFKVKNGRVIVPKKKGETVGLSKKGDIQITKKVGGKTLKSTFVKTKKGGEIKRRLRRIQYKIPFVRGRHKNGKPKIAFMRFPDYDSLKKFMRGYDYKGWKNFVVEEEISESQYEQEFLDGDENEDEE